VDFSVGGVIDEHKAQWKANRLPFLERFANAIDVTGHPIIDRCARLDPYRERPITTIRPTCERRISLLKDLGDVGARLVASQPTAHRGTIGFVKIVATRWKECASDASGRALFARRGERMRDGDFG
jgi:hypothetical protein